jgi:hypothetical protein
MKVIMSICFSLVMLTSVAQSKKYEEAMKKNLALWDQAKDNDELLNVAKGFEQIAATEKKDWLSSYYAGICYVVISFSKSGKDIDTWADKAEMACNKADSLSKNNSEIYVLRSMIASSRIAVNGAVRGPKYGKLSEDYLKTALKLNDNNPRAYLQNAQAVFYTPEVFGGGPKKAKPIYEKAVEKYKTFKPSSAIHPRWGKEMATKALAECEAKINSKE